MNSNPLKIIVSQIGVAEISTGYDGGKIEVNSRDLIETVETEMRKHGIECDEYGKFAAKVTIIVEPCGYQKVKMTELKPCPFCGGKRMKYGYVDDRLVGFGERHHYMCVRCCAKTGTYSTKEEAINAWNRRTDND